MAKEIQAPVGITGLTVYAVILNPTNGQWWYTVTPAFEAYNATHWTSYAITLTEIGATGVYMGDFPTGIATAGRYGVIAFTQAGGSPAVGDSEGATGSVDWTGAAVSVPFTVAQIATGIFQDTTAGDFTVPGSIGLSLFTGVAPGASGGVFIAGTNDHLTITNAFMVQGGTTFSNSNANGVGFLCQGGSGGHGLQCKSPGLTSTGDGINAQGGANGGRGIHALGGTTSGAGFRAEAVASNNPGIHGVGHGTGAGIEGDGGATGNGMLLNGGATSGAAFRAVGAAGNANGGEFVHNGTGVDLQADIGGRVLGNTATSFVGDAALVTVNDYTTGQDPNTLIFDAASTVEGYTFRQATRLMGAVLCGTANGGPSGTVFAGMGVATARVTSVDDTSGNRSSVILSP